MDKYLLLAGLLCLSLPVSAHAAQPTLTGKQLVEMCTSRAKKADAFCTAWMGGFTSGLFGAQMAAKKGDDGVCLPEGLTPNQVRAIIEKFMNDHPSIRDLDAGSLGFVALRSAFPCVAKR